MIYSDIAEELIEAIGSSDQNILYRATQRGCEMLANKDLFDPLIAYLDFYVEGGYLIALPRDVKTPLAININSNPSFARSRIFEFALNSPGSMDGAEVGWQWHERGYACVQDERKLPGQVQYFCAQAADNGAAATIYGIDTSGIFRTEILTASNTVPTPSQYAYAQITRLVRSATTAECYLQNTSAESIARYYPDETEPEYRVIKLSQTGIAVRMMYRKHVFKINSPNSIILFHSPMAVVQAAKAARLMQEEQWERAALAMSLAEQLAKEEQAARSDGDTIAQTMQVQNAINSNISTRDSIIAADVYDEACKIFGTIGRQYIFDKLTTAQELLCNKGQQDANVGWVDIWKAANETAINVNASKPGNGFYVLPRYVQAILALNFNGRRGFARNRWFEYHLDGPGEQRLADHGTWNDFGEVVITNMLPIDPTSKQPIGVYLIATPNNALDNGTSVQVFGYDLNNNRIRVDGSDGITVPCVAGGTLPNPDAPRIARIERIIKGASTDFITLNCYTDAACTQNQLQLGYWYPDETEPKYQMIEVPSDKLGRIRCRYRKRWSKINSLNDPMMVRSRMALATMMRSMKAMETDPQSAAALEVSAVQYLMDDQFAQNPIQQGGLQFNRGTSPFHSENVA